MQYNQEAVRIKLGDTLLMDKGQPLPFDEKAASAYLKGRADVHGTVNIQASAAPPRGPLTALPCSAAGLPCWLDHVLQQTRPRHAAWLAVMSPPLFACRSRLATGPAAAWPGAATSRTTM